jgi:hypothetical protein
MTDRKPFNPQELWSLSFGQLTSWFSRGEDGRTAAFSLFPIPFAGFLSIPFQPD